MKTYPIMLRIEGRLVVVVGCGSVGMRKVGELLEAGAVVRLVCGDGDPGDLDGVEVIRDEYRSEFVADASIVFACTDDASLNTRISNDAREIGAFANAADQPDDCDFFSPAVYRDCDLVIAIGSGNASPGLSGLIKNRIKETMPPELGKFADAMREAREIIKTRIDSCSNRMSIMRSISTWETFELYRHGGRAAVLQRLDDALAGKSPTPPPSAAHHSNSLCMISAITLVVCAVFFAILRDSIILHIAMSSVSMFSIGASAWFGWKYLQTNARLKSKTTVLLSRNATSLEKLDKNCRAGLTYGFLCFSIAIVFGIISRPESWLGNWVNHPKITGALVGWCICLFAVLAAWSSRFQGKRMAILSIVGFILIFIVMAISLVK